MTGIELTRISIPCRRDRYSDTMGPDGWWPTPEPPHRINQVYLEPLLLGHAAAQAGVSLLNRTQVTGHIQEDECVTVALLDLDHNTSRQMRALPRRLRRRQFNRSQANRRPIGRHGRDPARAVHLYIRAPGLLSLIPGKPAWSYYSVNPRRCGTTFAIDGYETWLVHNHLNAEEPEFDSVDRDWALRQILRGTGFPLRGDQQGRLGWAADWWPTVSAIETCSSQATPPTPVGALRGLWNERRHCRCSQPWLLAARLQGWADEGILDAYEAERQPITEQVSHL